MDWPLHINLPLRNKLPDEILKQLYFAFVNSHITYAAEIYINTYDSYLDKLNKLIKTSATA